MPRKKLVEEELENKHQKVLDVMDEDKSYSSMEITEHFMKKYPDDKQVKRWGTYKGDLCRYVIVRYLTFLRNRGYVEADSAVPGKWRKVRESPLLKEVAEAYIFLGKANSLEEAILKLAKEFITSRKTDFEALVRNIGEAKKAIKRENETRKRALSSALKIMGNITRYGKETNEVPP